MTATEKQGVAGEGEIAALSDTGSTIDTAFESAVADLIPIVGTAAACAAVGRPRATHYAHHRSSPAPPRRARARPPRRQPRALDEHERANVLQVLQSPRFVDMAPAEVHATLLDEGTYLCSSATMYRLLRDAHGGVLERRRQAVHPARVKPELVAQRPNQVWSWDITKLAGPAKWSYYYLYTIIDIYSRYVVGWMIATCESQELAQDLLAATIAKQHVNPGELTIHSDNGASMASHSVAFLLADLGVTKTHSRPHTSNDNPYSESAFKTLKYRPDFPDRFGSLAHARGFCQHFYTWYNHDHRHSGIGMHTPADVHHHRAAAVRARRAQVLDAAHTAHPERFVRHRPQPAPLPGPAWINPPTDSTNDHAN